MASPGFSLQWRYNEHDGVSNHQPHDCLLNHLSRRRSKKHQRSASLAFVWGIHWSPMNSSHKGQWRGALMLPLICAWISRWVNNRDAGDWRRHRAHYDVTVMNISIFQTVFFVLMVSAMGYVDAQIWISYVCRYGALECMNMVVSWNSNYASCHAWVYLHEHPLRAFSLIGKWSTN